MEWKEFKAMWNKAYWYWVGIYTAISITVTALIAGSLYLYCKWIERKEQEEIEKEVKE